MNGDNSGTNTVLIVIVLLVVVGLAVWFFRGGIGAPAQEQPGVNVDVTLPEGSGQQEAPAGGAQ